MNARTRYLRGFFALKLAHTKIHRALAAFKGEDPNRKVLAQLLEARAALDQAINSLGHDPTK